MGAWGAGILQDDSVTDIIGDYRILLGYKVKNEEAYELIKKTYYTDFKGADDEDIFWFALAIYQVRNGILLEEVKENAFRFLENPTSLDVWKDSGESIYQNRLKVLAKLKDELLNPSVTSLKKIAKPPSYWREKTKFKVGDLLAYKIKYDYKNKYNGKYALFRVIKIFRRPITKVKPELDYSSSSGLGLYNWIGSMIPSAEIAEDLEFIYLKNYCEQLYPNERIYHLVVFDGNEDNLIKIGDNINFKNSEFYEISDMAVPLLSGHTLDKTLEYTFDGVYGK